TPVYPAATREFRPRRGPLVRRTDFRPRPTGEAGRGPVRRVTALPAGGVMGRPLIAVMGSGNEEHAELAEPLGRWLAESGYDLLTGGGGGVMAAVCRGFAAVPTRRGLSVGILPAGPPPGYPNRHVD